jgi:hypothetical protein
MSKRTATPIALTPKRKALLDKFGSLIESLSDESLMELSGYACGLLGRETSPRQAKPATVIHLASRRSK